VGKTLQSTLCPPQIHCHRWHLHNGELAKRDIQEHPRIAMLGTTSSQSSRSAAHSTHLSESASTEKLCRMLMLLRCDFVICPQRCSPPIPTGYVTMMMLTSSWVKVMVVGGRGGGQWFPLMMRIRQQSMNWGELCRNLSTSNRDCHNPCHP